MPEWLVDVAGPDYARGVLWTIAALFLLVVVLAVVKVVRSMTFGTFVAGGRNRKTRLAVMDATPVDSHRRLVLVRRDDVEHLILIGGPTDVVVEQGIRLGQVRRPAPAEGPGAPRPGPPHRPPLPPQPDQAPRRAAPNGSLPERRPAPPAAERARPVQHVAPAAAKPATPTPPPRPFATTPDNYLPRDLQARTTLPANAMSEELDTALVKELSVSLDQKPGGRVAPSIEEEMNKLLGELASPKR